MYSLHVYLHYYNQSTTRCTHAHKSVIRPNHHHHWPVGNVAIDVAHFFHSLFWYFLLIIIIKAWLVKKKKRSSLDDPSCWQSEWLKNFVENAPISTSKLFTWLIDTFYCSRIQAVDILLIDTVLAAEFKQGILPYTHISEWNYTHIVRTFSFSWKASSINCDR